MAIFLFLGIIIILDYTKIQKVKALTQKFVQLLGFNLFLLFRKKLKAKSSTY